MHNAPTHAEIWDARSCQGHRIADHILLCIYFNTLAPCASIVAVPRRHAGRHLHDIDISLGQRHRAVESREHQAPDLRPIRIETSYMNQAAKYVTVQ
eukprot:4501601-Pleurochrysis_carterae.AAC.1